MRRMEALVSGKGLGKPGPVAPLLDVEAKAEFAKALEPLLGVSSILLPSLSEDGRTHEPDTGSSGGKRRYNSESPGSLLCAYSQRRGFRSGSGGSYAAHPGASMLYKYQLMVDLSGAFGEEFGKVEEPSRRSGARLALLGRRAQEMQRDLTARRCLVPPEVLRALAVEGKQLEGELAAHTLLIDQAEERLQLIWQEALDRVRRQQLHFRAHKERSEEQRRRVRALLSAAAGFRPFVASISSAASLVCPQRSLAPAKTPMERVREQIEEHPRNESHLMRAIEEGDRLREEAKVKRHSQEINPVIQAVIGGLKHAPESASVALRPRKQRRPAVDTARDRSRGGTDPVALKRHSTGSRCESAAASVASSETNHSSGALSDEALSCESDDEASRPPSRLTSPLTLQPPQAHVPAQSSPKPLKLPSPKGAQAKAAAQVSPQSPAEKGTAGQQCPPQAGARDVVASPSVSRAPSRAPPPPPPPTPPPSQLSPTAKAGPRDSPRTPPPPPPADPSLLEDRKAAKTPAVQEPKLDKACSTSAVGKPKPEAAEKEGRLDKTASSSALGKEERATVSGGKGPPSPRLPLAMRGIVPAEVAEARDAVLRDIVQKVPLVQDGASNSPDSTPPPQ